MSPPLVKTRKYLELMMTVHGGALVGGASNWWAGEVKCVWYSQRRSEIRLSMRRIVSGQTLVRSSSQTLWKLPIIVNSLQAVLRPAIVQL